jgi:uncharacterized protein (DUF885 family)
MSDADDAFAALARSVVDGMLERRPELATMLGSHAYDSWLTIGSAEYHAEIARWCGDRLADVRAVDLGQLSPEFRVDAQILANQLERWRFGELELREHEWNPMLANPGRAIYLLLARDFAPPADRLRSMAGRLAAVPEALAAARSVMGGRLPRVHLETALGQFAGTQQLIGAELDRVLAEAGDAVVPGGLAAGRVAAVDAIAEHRRWLEQRLAEGSEADGSPDGAFRDPRIGAGLFRRKLQLTLESDVSPEELLARALADLDETTGRIGETAGRLGVDDGAGGEAELGGGDLVRQVLDSLAADAPDDTAILGLVRRAYEAQLAFVREHVIVTAYDDPVEVIEMPEIDRGVAVAYCDPPGPLETADLPTFVAVSPTPRDWTADRVRSFYREYNRHMVQNLMVHEAMPGHVLQLGHARRFSGGTPVRAAFRSGSFVEGWAVYAEELMASHGYPGEGHPDAVRMQQLKMRLRMIINTVLDVRVHWEGMPETEAMALMTRQGFQEEGEAAGKWRRALLTSTQLSAYYLGYREVCELVELIRAARPAWSEQQLHDALLAHGSPAARYLPPLVIGLPGQHPEQTGRANPRPRVLKASM